ncbi:hypothetical protein ACLB2K_001378 [Fragaria x ananassa]
MAKIVRSLFFLSLVITSSFSPITAQACSTHQFPDHKTFAACNPSSKGMVGSQALVAFQRTDGIMAVYSSPIKSYGTRLEQGNLTFRLEQGNLTFPVYTLSAVQENKEITIFAILGLPNNVTTVNHLWQQGRKDLCMVTHQACTRMSGPYLKSYGTLDFLSGKVEATGTHHSLLSPMKIFHGTINTVSWGVLLPLGAILARNLVHVSCQSLGLLGVVAGWVTGHILGSKSPEIQYKGHKCTGLTLLIFVNLQVLVGVLHPKLESKYRWLWNLFRYVVGYTTMILGIVNIFKGFDILEPPNWSKYT